MGLKTTQGLRILIIEDDLVDRKLLERLLSRSSLKITELKAAGCLKSALDMLAQETFDIMLADLGLPDSQGVESVSRLQRVAPQVPVIVLSGLDDDAVVADAAQHGVQDYLIKGQVDSALLNRAISYALERKKAELAMQAAQERYRIIFENSAVAIMMVDAQERLVSWNGFAENLLNISHEDLYHRPVKSLYPAREWENIRAQHLRETGSQRHLETQMIRQGGGVIDVDVSLSMVKDADGKTTGSVGVIRDITERKQVEKALMKSEERFRQVVENAEEWIWEVDAHGLYTYVSPGIERVLGCKPDEILGHKHFYDLFHPAERERLTQKAFEVFSRKDKFREFETKILDKNGQTVWLSKSGVPILDDQGALLGYRGVDVDITERRRTHEILNRKQKNLEAIFDAAPIGMLLVGENMRVGRANDAVRNLTGKDYGQIINQLPGQALSCVHAAEELDQGETRCCQVSACEECQLMDVIRDALDSGLPVHGAEIQPTLFVNGREIEPSFSVNAEPVIIDGARYAVVALNDITDRARAEKELRETMEMKSQFISTVSHELRTPLASMKEAVLIVLDGVAGELNDDQRHFLDLAMASPHRACLSYIALRSSVTIFGNIHNPDAHGPAVYALQPCQGLQCSAHVLFRCLMRHDHHRYRVLRSASLVLQGPGNADLMIAQYLAVLGHHTRLIRCQHPDIEPTHTLPNRLDQGAPLRSWRDQGVLESSPGITQGHINDVRHHCTGCGHHACPAPIEHGFPYCMTEHADGIEGS